MIPLANLSIPLTPETLFFSFSLSPVHNVSRQIKGKFKPACPQHGGPHVAGLNFSKGGGGKSSSFVRKPFFLWSKVEGRMQKIRESLAGTFLSKTEKMQLFRVRTSAPTPPLSPQSKLIFHGPCFLPLPAPLSIRRFINLRRSRQVIEEFKLLSC